MFIVFKQHWLNLVEYVAIAATIFGCLCVIATGQVLYALIPLSLALTLNRINRLRFELQSKKRITTALSQLNRQIIPELTSIEAKQAQIEQKFQQLSPSFPSPVIEKSTVAPPTTDEEITPDSHPTPETNLVAQSEPETSSITAITGSLHEHLASLEQSLSNVVRYLNTNSLAVRVDQLEKNIAQIKSEVTRLSRKSSGVEEADWTEAQPTKPLMLPLATSTSATLEASPDENPSTDAPINWQQLQTLSGHTDVIAALAIDPQGRWLASVSWDRALRLWDLGSGELLADTEAHDKGVLAVTFTKQNGLATGGFDQTIKLWRWENNEQRFSLAATDSLSGHLGSIRTLTTAAEGQTLISGSYDQTIKLWNLDNQEIKCSLFDQSGAIGAIALSVDEQLLASGSADGRILLWRLDQATPIATLVGNVQSVLCVAISPDGKNFAAGCVDGTIKLWHLETDDPDEIDQNQPQKVIDAHLGQVTAVIFSLDGGTLFSSGADATVKSWHLKSFAPTLIGQFNAGVTTLALSRDGKFLCTGTRDGMISIWQRV